jgi:hypothetical protein
MLPTKVDMTATGWIKVSIEAHIVVFMYIYSNSNVLGCCKEPVNENTHEGGVKTEFNRQCSKLGVSHALRHDDSTNGDA